MRDIVAALKAENARAQLAFDIYVRRIRQAIGGLAVMLSRVDALVFTAGVGEHAAEVREGVCTGLECVGLHLDQQANTTAHPDADIAATDSPGRILIITAEDTVMLREVRRVLGDA